MSERYSHLEQWGELVRVALMGTTRRPPPPIRPEPWGVVASQLAAAEPAAQLLNQAAATTAYQKAGRLPLAAQASPPTLALPTEVDLPLCSPRASQYLQSILDGQHRDLLPEWLRLAAVAGYRVAPAQLPALLNAGRQNGQLRPLIRPVLGARGRWLAGHNDAWAYVLPLAETAWATGTRAQRRRYLEQVRRTEPAAGRQLLQSDWAREDATSRQTLLPVLAVGLTAADESFLSEVVAGDRSQAVREQALDLLAALPAARLFRAAFQAAQKYLRFSGRRGWRRRERGLTVSLPTRHTNLMQKLGILVAPKNRRQPEAWWLERLIALVPPAWWVEDEEPDTLLAAAAATPWHELLRSAWAAAAARHGDVAWARAWLNTMDDPVPAADPLLALLPPPEREALAGTWLRRHPSLNQNTPGHWVLRGCDHPWRPPFSQIVLASIARHIQQGDIQYAWKWSEMLSYCARQMDPAILPEARRLLEKIGLEAKLRARDTQALLATLQFRREMHRALNPESGEASEDNYE